MRKLARPALLRFVSHVHNNPEVWGSRARASISLIPQRVDRPRFVRSTDFAAELPRLRLLFEHRELAVHQRVTLLGERKPVLRF
jgi:hypothetical protein